MKVVVETFLGTARRAIERIWSSAQFHALVMLAGLVNLGLALNQPSPGNIAWAYLSFGVILLTLSHWLDPKRGP